MPISAVQQSDSVIHIRMISLELYICISIRLFHSGYNYLPLISVDILCILQYLWGFPGGTSGKEPTNVGDIRDVGLIPWLGRSPEGGHGNPLQYTCLENPMDRGTWWATIHRLTNSQIQLKQLSTAI